MHFLWFAKRFGVVWWAVAKRKQNKACLIVLQIIAAPGPPLPKHITPPKMKTSHQASYKVKHLKNLVRRWTGSQNYFRSVHPVKFSKEKASHFKA